VAREVSTGILIVSDADVNLAAFQHGRLIGAKSFGAETGTPLVFLQHFRGGLDRSSILFDRTEKGRRRRDHARIPERRPPAARSQEQRTRIPY
jgi:hypothetical protein